MHLPLSFRSVGSPSQRVSNGSTPPTRWSVHVERIRSWAMQRSQLRERERGRRTHNRKLHATCVTNCTLWACSRTGVDTFVIVARCHAVEVLGRFSYCFFPALCTIEAVVIECKFCFNFVADCKQKITATFKMTRAQRIFRVHVLVCCGNVST